VIYNYKKVIFIIRNKINKIIIKQDNVSNLYSYWRSPTIDPTGKKSNQPERYAEKQLLPRSQFVVDIIKKLANKESKIIELGCSVGRNLNLLMAEGFTNLHGIELNEKAISLMENIYPNLNKIVNNIEVGSIENNINKYPQDYFHIVFTMATLQHIHKDQEIKVFNEIERICGKYLIVIEDEYTISERHFARNYNKIFSKLGFKQVLYVAGKKIEEAFLPFTYKCRVFSK